MTSQNLSDLQRDATKWWISLSNEDRIKYAKKYIGTSDPKTMDKLEIMYSYCYFKQGN